MRNHAARTEELLLEIGRRIFTAIKTKDDETLSKIVADDFVFRGPGQPEIGKAEFLNGVKSFPIEILDVWSDDMKVNIYGDTALMTGVQQARTRDKKGKEQLSAGAFCDLFANRRERWVLVLAYNVELPEIQPPLAGVTNFVTGTVAITEEC